jgi:hypothetical protein
MPKSKERSQKVIGRNQKERPTAYRQGSFVGKLYEFEKTVSGQKYKFFRATFHSPDGQLTKRETVAPEKKPRPFSMMPLLHSEPSAQTCWRSHRKTAGTSTLPNPSSHRLD